MENNNNNHSNNNGKADHQNQNKVPLPGAETNSIEQPVILQVLSSILPTDDKEKKQATEAAAAAAAISNDECVDQVDCNNINLVNSCSKPPHLVSNVTSPSSDSLAADSKVTAPTSIASNSSTAEEADNILDIESHLIETYDEFPSNETDSVGINELQPVEDELQIGCSKIDSHQNLRTVIEVEPAALEIKQPIAKIIETAEPLNAASSSDLSTEAAKSDKQQIPAQVLRCDIEQAAHQLVEEIEKDIIDKQDSCFTAAAAAINGEDTRENEIELVAQKLVHEIGQEIVDRLNENYSHLENQRQQTEETAAHAEDLKTEELKEDIIQAADQLVDEIEKEIIEKALLIKTDEAAETEPKKQATELSKAADQLVEEIEKEIIEKAQLIKTEEAATAKQTKDSKELCEAANQLVDEIEKEIIEKPLLIKTKEAAKAEAKQPKDSKELYETANQLVDEIEKEIIEKALLIKTNEAANTASSEQPKDSTELSQAVDQQLSEVNSILKAQSTNEQPANPNNFLHIQVDNEPNLKVISVPSPTTSLEEQERKLFLDSLPHIQSSTGAAASREQQLALDCKREYYQSLKKYLVDSNTDRPPVPLQTYRWEDLRRARERGGYPWTHLYKRPLGPDEEPEIVLMLRKSQEIRFTSESPKSNKRVRIDDQVLIKTTERYIQELSEDEDDQDEHHSEQHLATHTSPDSDLENHSLHSESFSCVSDSILATGRSTKKSNRFSKVRRLFRRKRYGARQNDDIQSLPGSFNSSSSLPQSLDSQEQLSGSQATSLAQSAEPIYVHTKSARCFPIMKKLKSMADRQKRRFHLKSDNDESENVPKVENVAKVEPRPLVSNEPPKLIKLKGSPSKEHIGEEHEHQNEEGVEKEKPAKKVFVNTEHQKLIKLKGSPPSQIKTETIAEKAAVVNNKNQRLIKLKGSPTNERTTATKEQEITEAQTVMRLRSSPKAKRSDIPHFIEKRDSDDILDIVELDESPCRKRREEQSSTVEPEEIIELDANDAAPPKKAPRLRREHVYEEIEQPDAAAATDELKFILDATSVDAIRQSLITQDNSAIKEVSTVNNTIPLDRMGSSEEDTTMPLNERATPDRKLNLLKAPISSIDSTSSDEDRSRPQLQPVTEEESDHTDHHEEEEEQRRPALKKEASPAPSDKKVTFSHVEDEAEPHREDIDLPAEQLEATKEANKWKSQINDHEYEPIGASSMEETPTKAAQAQTTAAAADTIGTMKQAEDMQKDIEDRFFSSSASSAKPTPHTEIEVDTTQLEEDDVDMDAAEPPLKPTERKGFMASAQDRTRKMQVGIRNQAGKLKTKLKPTPKKMPSGSPKAKDRKMFKAPEFSKLKMPEIKRPDMSKLKEFKRPEFTKFNKPDMSKFKLPEKITSMKLGRSKSFKEPEASMDVEESEATAQKSPDAPASTQKKLFDFNFGTYPRALRKKKPSEPVTAVPSLDTATATEATSVMPSTLTQPSFESSSSPQGDRGPGPVRSRWADKFSDVSYNDSEGSRYRRYGSEQESFDRESSLERRMRDDLDDRVSEENLGIMGGVTDNKQFAEFDEENRAIHEISNLRSGEFRRRPMVHQDSDVRSEDSKEAVGWSEKDIQKNTLLRKAEAEAESSSYLKYQTDEMQRHETQSTASSGKKLVLEEIGEDEFFLRKRGISQDNSEIGQYIRSAFREDVQHADDVLPPPPKPRRLHKNVIPDNTSQDYDAQRSEYSEDFSGSQNGSDFFAAPRRPLRKGRSRSKYSMESQELDDAYMRDVSPPHSKDILWNKENILLQQAEDELDHAVARPQAPRRQKKQSSVDKDSFVNGFGGRSVSNTILQPTEDVIVYRTEHEYHHIPLATAEKYSDTMSANKSISNYEYDDRTSRGAISLEPIEYADARKYVIDMNESDGYAVVRKDQVPKPTPPARRKRFSHSPGERFATMPNMRTKKATPPPPERPPPPRSYTPASDIVLVSEGKSAQNLDAQLPPNYEDDYEEPSAASERPESPRNLQSGDIINKMKYRPLPPPPRPPREKRIRTGSKESEAMMQDYRDEDMIDGASSSYMDEEEIPFEEVEASTQTDPLPDDFVCEEFEITDDMKVIEPRIRSKNLEEMLKEEQDVSHQFIDGEQLALGLQRFRDANQRSLSERSRASSQADRSKSASRPQTPLSAILVERQQSTPVQKENNETLLQASLVVRPMDDLELEEEQLRREGLLSDSSQPSIPDIKEELEHNIPMSEASYAPSSTELDEALTNLAPSDQEAQQTDEEVERTLQRYRDELDEIGRQLMEAPTTSQEPSPSVSREEIKGDWQIDSEKEIMSDSEEASLSSSDIALDLALDGLTKGVGVLEPLPEEITPEEEIATPEEDITLAEEDYAIEPPQPPPRRKSATFTELTESKTISDTAAAAEVVESIEAKQLAAVQSIVHAESEQSRLPARMGDLEVERLRVHALQAGQIMVSQLHGQQISSDQLECKSGNLVVQNIELPPELIDDIVERVRKTERKPELLSAETQTSLEGSSERLPSTSPAREMIPPPKPPRLRDLEAASKSTAAAAIATLPSTHIPNADEQTQTEQTVPVNNIPSGFPTAEYLNSLAPLAFYNLHRATAELQQHDAPVTRSRRHRRASSSEYEEDAQRADEREDIATKQRRARSLPRRMPSEDDPQSVTQAGRKFITACSLSLAKIINQLTDFVRGKNPREATEPTDMRSRQVPALVVLFLVITFVVLIYLLTGRNVHTHHWDFFNPPGQEGRKEN